MSGSDETYSALEYMLSSACGLLWPCPVVLGVQAATSRGLGAGNAYSLVEALGHIWSVARVLPRVKEGGGTVRQMVKSYLSVPIVGQKSESVDYSRD
jgi:hypothetical protein